MRGVAKICEHCDGDGHEPRQRMMFLGCWVVVRYWKRVCSVCNGTGEDRSVSVDELEEIEEPSHA
jgi:DnaJ-class molecular chaperone